MKGETRNWIASFTTTGCACVPCRDEDGKINHRGRDVQPITLVVRGESVQYSVGHTKMDRNEGLDQAGTTLNGADEKGGEVNWRDEWEGFFGKADA